MKVKIKKGSYFYHPPKGKDGRKKPVVVVPVMSDVDVPKAEADRLVKLDIAEVVRDLNTEVGEKPKSEKDSKPKADSENEKTPETPEPAETPATPETDNTDDGDIVV